MRVHNGMMTVGDSISRRTEQPFSRGICFRVNASSAVAVVAYRSNVYATAITFCAQIWIA